MGGLHLITSAPSYICRWKDGVSHPGTLLAWISGKHERPEIGVILVWVVGVLQLLACVGWIIWAALARPGVPWYVEVLIGAVLLLGAFVLDFARRRLETRAFLAAELQRFQSQDPLDRRLQTVKERVRSLETLREWGLVTEEEYQEKRSSLLDLERPRSPKAGPKTGPEGSTARKGGRGN